MPWIDGIFSSIGPAVAGPGCAPSSSARLIGERRVLHAKRHRARRGAVLTREPLRERIRLGVDDEVDVALPMQGDVLRPMPRDHRKAQPLEQGRAAAPDPARCIRRTRTRRCPWDSRTDRCAWPSHCAVGVADSYNCNHHKPEPLDPTHAHAPTTPHSSSTASCPIGCLCSPTPSARRSPAPITSASDSRFPNGG